MKVKLFYSTMLTLLLSITLMGCGAVDVYPAQNLLDGQVNGVMYGTARWIIEGALEGEFMTRIFISPDDKLITYARSLGDGWAWVTTKSGETINKYNFCGGNFSNCSTFSDFARWMKDNGWKEYTGISAMTAALADQIKYIASSVSKLSITPIFIFPSTLDINPYLQEEQAQ